MPGIIFFISLRRFTSIKVDRLKEYKIAFRGLGEGKHSFNYTLDKVFFGCFESTKDTEGEVEALVEIMKGALLMEVKLKISGTVRAVCDRCLGSVDLKIEGEMHLFVKQGIRESSNDDDFIVLAPDDDFLDLSSYLYEVYMLNYPMRVVHEDGECDEEMEKVLDEYIMEENKQTDPRWDELKKLINN